METVTLSVPTVHCHACQMNIEEALDDAGRRRLLFGRPGHQDGDAHLRSRGRRTRRDQRGARRRRIPRRLTADRRARGLGLRQLRRQPMAAALVHAPSIDSTDPSALSRVGGPPPSAGRTGLRSRRRGRARAGLRHRGPDQVHAVGTGRRLDSSSSRCPRARALKNRLHLDLAPHTSDDRDAEIARLHGDGRDRGRRRPGPRRDVDRPRRSAGQRVLRALGTRHVDAIRRAISEMHQPTTLTRAPMPSISMRI